MTNLATTLTSPLFYETDTNNNPLAGGHVYTYQVVGHFSGSNVTMDVANGFSVSCSSSNGYIALVISGGFSAGTTAIADTEGIVRLT
jgi:hypothetical protein